MDLASLNIQRGRDHGLPPYVQWREPCGLSPIRNFDDLDRVMSPNVARKFKSLYSSVEDIDLFPAGLAEKSVVGGLVGPTFACIIGQQFSNLRRGDRFWYENSESESSFTVNQLQQIRQITLAQILCKTVDGLETIQPFVFLTMDTLKNQRLSCKDSFIGHLNLEFWIEKSSEFRNNVDDSQKTKQTTNMNNPFAPKSTEDNANSRRKINHQEQEKITLPKPFKTSINQNNRIIVKRPFGRPDNVTIMVQNNAVNSPVFVNDGIYGSHIRIQQQPITKPASNFNYGINNHPMQPPQTNPIPITIPPANFQFSYPYVLHAVHDSNNPNPIAYGYKSLNLTRDNIFYDYYFPTSPRPTLYTYYTNFQQQSTTRMPNHEIDDYLINYGSSHQKTNPLLTRIYELVKPSVNPGQIYELNNQQKSNSILKLGDDLKSSINLQSMTKPNYQSYEVQPLTEHSYLQKDKLNNIPHENHFNNINKSYYDWYLHNGQKKSSEKPYDYNYSSSYQKVPIVKLPNDSADHKTWHTFNPHQNVSNNKPNSENNSQASKLNSMNYINNFMQSGPYSASSTRVPAYQERFDLNNLPLANPQGSLTSQRDYESDPEVSFSSAYQKGSTPIQYTLMSNSSYVKDTQSDFQNDTFASHNSLFYQKSTNTSTYERNDQSQLSFYSKDRPITVANQYEYGDSNKKTPISSNLTDQWSASTYQNSSTQFPYWFEISTTGFQVDVEESHISKPMKMQNVTATTEKIETVHQYVHSEYINQYTPSIESPRSVIQNTKNNMMIIGKPGQYYYEKNVLRRYPDKPLVEIPKNNYHWRNKSEKISLDKIVPESIAIKTSVIHSVMNNKVIQKDQNQLTTTPMLIIMDHNNKESDIIDNFKNASSASIRNVASADVTNRYSFNTMYLHK